MKMMKSMRWLLLVAGVLLVILGISMLFTPFENLLGLAIFISISLLVSGVSEIVAYFGDARETRSGWMLAGGILSTIVGLWLLFGHRIQALAVALPFVFAVWMVSAGITRAIGSFSLKSLGSSQWGWVLAFGILGIFLGFSLMFSPILSALIVSVMVASVFICHGVSDIAMFFTLTRN